MPIGIRNLEWLNHNSVRSYPLAADTTKQDTTSTFTLPNDFLVGMYFPIPWYSSLNPGQFYINRIFVFSAGVQIQIAYNAATVIPVAVATIPRNTHTRYQAYSLGGVGNFADGRGWVQVDGFDNLDLQPAGEFNFDINGTRLETDVIRPNIRGITSIRVENAGELSIPLYDQIKLRAGRNMRITVNTPLNQPPEIVFDAIESAGLNNQCICIDDLPDPIRSINNVTPDENGNILITTNSCLSLTPGNHALIMEDTCSEPCCGCTELEKITEVLEALSTKVTTLDSFLAALNANVTEMDQRVLGSKLGDRSCYPQCPTTAAP